MYKPFSQELHNQNDFPARELVKRSFLDHWGITLIDNPDRYGVDLLAYRKDKFVGYVEIEVKHNWVGHKFPYEAIHIPSRKERIFNYLPLIFVVINKDMTHFMWFNLESVKTGKRITKKTKLTDFEDSFIEISVSEGFKIACSDYAS